MTFDFYLDITCSFILQVFENVCCHDEEQSREKQIKFKVRVLIIRILFGFLTNIAVFISICVMNMETFIDGPTALGLFCVIILHTIILYGTVTVYLLCSYTPGTEALEFDEDRDGPTTMAAYRFHEIIFDLLVLFYSLVLSEWEMTEFATATTVLSCLDIVVNCVILGHNWYDVCTRARKKPDILAPVCVLCVTFLPCCLCSLYCLLCGGHDGEKRSRREV
jgi:hypothetical protein